MAAGYYWLSWDREERLEWEEQIVVGSSAYVISSGRVAAGLCSCTGCDVWRCYSSSHW